MTDLFVSLLLKCKNLALKLKEVESSLTEALEVEPRAHMIWSVSERWSKRGRRKEALWS